MWCLLQGHLLWLANGSTGYQNWLYPYENADYLLQSSYGSSCDILNYLELLHVPNRVDKQWNVTWNQLPGIQHFQPQLSPQRQCVAEIVPGYKDFKRQWVKIDCDQLFHNVHIICERQRTNYTPPGGNLISHTIYANIKFIENDDGTLSTADNYC